MGLRGPVPIPTAINAIRGNPGKRSPRKDEPGLPVSAPPCPEHLDAEARKNWERLAPLLMTMGVLTQVDGMALGELCSAYSTLAGAQNQLNKVGILYKDDGGKIRPNPLLKVIAQQTAIVQSLMREFGLTPSSRTRIRTEPVVGAAKPTNKFARLAG